MYSKSAELECERLFCLRLLFHSKSRLWWTHRTWIENKIICATLITDFEKWILVCFFKRCKVGWGKTVVCTIQKLHSLSVFAPSKNFKKAVPVHLWTLTNTPSLMRSLGVYLGDIYLLHVAIFAHLPKRPLEAKILFYSK